MQSRAEIRYPTPEENRAENIVVDLLSTVDAREREWRRFRSPHSRSPDFLYVSSIGDSDTDEGGGMRVWLGIGCKRTFSCWIFDTRAGSEVRGRDQNFRCLQRRRHELDRDPAKKKLRLPNLLCENLDRSYEVAWCLIGARGDKS
ncbi:hypothetical protein TIFTF001_021416 [Ficus carica]|uniref:Uncharacterized protein n=1 Tax=Ficus carica TaxID=3494 RepID=A0AA88DEJ7_FICCA|nr:hypothetical protein TIFTF001_021416 [Ficus carica]